MKTPRRYTLSALLAATAAFAAPAAWAHATLQSANPAKDSEVSGTIREVTLQFNEKLEASFSNAKVLDAEGKEISTKKATLDANDRSKMRVAVPALAPGKYTVQFTVVGHDGHRRKGDYSFIVK